MKDISLQHKILFGYIVLMAVITSMVAILLHERKRLREIEAETVKIRSVRLDINKAHRRITELATRGEGVIAWENTDYEEYHAHRLRTDSLLQTLKLHCRNFVRSGQIDTLRHLLAEKETHLHRIMNLFRSQDSLNSLLLTRLPEEAKAKTVTRKKKGIAGLFGAKETVQVTPSASAAINVLNNKLLSIQKEHQETVDTYAYSLNGHNKELNRKLRTLIATMDNRTEHILGTKIRSLEASYDRSVRIITGLVITAILLLVISCLLYTSPSPRDCS